MFRLTERGGGQQKQSRSPTIPPLSVINICFLHLGGLNDDDPVSCRWGVWEKVASLHAPPFHPHPPRLRGNTTGFYSELFSLKQEHSDMQSTHRPHLPCRCRAGKALSVHHSAYCISRPPCGGRGMFCCHSCTCDPWVKVPSGCIDSPHFQDKNF